ncbi:hypothetical protein HNQ50_000324 [Silvimonas terrae]|uniref:Uncharacterized protein n=1 Tax=Silvimonas terrae TaxID=300266 RepID=A0A840RAI9_9NEIS|nr:hypothetical protein [Silvimonas terrae]MBB5189614.1 hypothetical protein [Silvimonas terrae]
MSQTELLLSAVTGLLSVLLTIIGWLAVTLYNKHERLRSDHEALRVEVARDYLAKSELREVFADFKDDIHKLIGELKEDLRTSMWQDRRHATERRHGD